MFHTIVMVFIVNTAQGVTKMFSVDIHKRLMCIAQRLIKDYEMCTSTNV